MLTLETGRWHRALEQDFTSAPGSAEDLSLTLDRAIGAYYNRRAWHNLQMRAMLSDVGWEGPALEYSQLYQRLLES